MNSPRSAPGEPQRVNIEASPKVRRRSRQERKCPSCGLCFTKTEHLERHVRSHTKEKPFGCTICGKAFARHDTLLRHSRSHTGSASAQRSNGSFTIAAGDRSRSSISEYEASDDRMVDRDQSNLLPTVSHIQSISNMSSPATTPAVPDPPGFPKPGIRSETAVSSRNFQYQAQHSGASGPVNFEGCPSLDTLADAAFASDVLQSNAWDIDFDSQYPAWLAGDDFDLDALNTSILATFSSTRPSPTNFPSSAPGLDMSQSDLAIQRPGNALSKRWFTHLTNDNSGRVTPRAPTEQAQVDEVYRDHLSRKLQHQLYDHPLPSTEFLNLCIRMYFSRFNPIFPVVHSPTFRPSPERALLLLSICSVGSLFIGSASATAQGIRIFERLNKAILASWESYMSHGAEFLSMIQAALIGQTFGQLSGNPKDLIMVESFHGTVVAWARKNNMFRQRQQDTAKVASLSGPELESAWKTWARVEEEIRVVLGLHIHDAELASIFHHEPLLRHKPMRLPKAAPNELFLAPNASQWARLLANHPASQATPSQYRADSMNSPGYSMNSPGYDSGSSLTQVLQSSGTFEAYTILAGIGASICETRQLRLMGSCSQQQYVRALIEWYTECGRRMTNQTPDLFCLMILWHLNFMSLFADFDALECAIGRDGPTVAEGAVDEVKQWAASMEAKRCVLHASLLQKHLETMRLGAEPAIHVPRALFFAALAWYAYSRFCPDTDEKRSSFQNNLDFPEMKLLDVNASLHLFEANGFRFGKPATVDSSTLYGIMDLLQRIGHWQIARRFAMILEVLIGGETEGKTDASSSLS